jgi:septal ring factor EnvC (AmiA/AmiB activator)
LEAWTDERLNDLAATLRSLQTDVGEIKIGLAKVTADVANLTEAVNHLIEDNRAIRANLAALHRQIAQIGWGLSGALVGVLIALIVAVV